MSSEDEHRDPAHPWMLADPAQHFPTVYSGEPDVEDQQCRRVVDGRLQAAGPVFGAEHRPAHVAQAHLDQSLDQGRVLDYQNVVRHVLALVRVLGRRRQRGWVP